MGTTEFKAVPYALYAKDGAGAQELNDLDDAKFDGSSLFVGQGAGINDDGSDNENTVLGDSAFYNNTVGYENTAIGFPESKNLLGASSPYLPTSSMG